MSSTAESTPVLQGVLRRETGRQFAVVVQANRDLEAWERDLSFWAGALGEDGGRGVLTLPASEGDPYARTSPHADTLERRALSLWRLARGDAPFVLLSARALVRRTVAPARLLEAGAVLRRDEDLPPGDFLGMLLAPGYGREDPV